jgi:hypothetical protein
MGKILRFLKGLITGQIMVDIIYKHVYIIIYLLVFGIFYIANSVEIQRKYREISKLKIELQNIRSEYVNSIAEIMSLKRLSSVKKRVEEEGLELYEAKETVYTIK